jgi:hypothetical protein
MKQMIEAFLKNNCALDRVFLPPDTMNGSAPWGLASHQEHGLA